MYASRAAKSVLSFVLGRPGPGEKKLTAKTPFGIGKSWCFSHACKQNEYTAESGILAERTRWLRRRAIPRSSGLNGREDAAGCRALEKQLYGSSGASAAPIGAGVPVTTPEP